jgi:hypothetical protein
MSTLSETLSGYFSDPQLTDLKRIALASLGLGAGIPLVREMFKTEAPITLPTSGGSSVSIPVPEDDMASALPSYTSRSSNKPKGSLREIKNYNPAANLKEKRAFELSSLTNMAYLPAMTAALTVPGIAGHYLTNKIIDYKNKSEASENANKSKEDFAKAMLEANSNRLNRAIIADNPAEQAASDLYDTAKHLSGKALDNSKKLLDKSKKLFARRPSIEDMEIVKASSDISFTIELSADLDKLAGLELEKLAADPTAGTYLSEGAKLVGNWFDKKTSPRKPGEPEPTSIWRDASDAVLGSIGDAIKGTAGALYDNAVVPAFNTVLPVLKGYGGVLGAAGLIGAGAGTLYGHRAAQRNDKETADSYKYLSEFLRRQQEEGSPVYATPTPVTKAKKPWYSLS